MPQTKRNDEDSPKPPAKRQRSANGSTRTVKSSTISSRSKRSAKPSDFVIEDSDEDENFPMDDAPLNEVARNRAMTSGTHEPVDGQLGQMDDGDSDDDDFSPEPPAKKKRGASARNTKTGGKKKIGNKAVASKKGSPSKTKKDAKNKSDDDEVEAPAAKKTAGRKRATKKANDESVVTVSKKTGSKQQSAEDVDIDTESDTSTPRKSTASKAKAQAKTTGNKSKKEPDSTSAPASKVKGKATKAGSKKVDADKTPTWRPVLCVTGLENYYYLQVQEIAKQKHTSLKTEFNSKVTHLIVGAFDAHTTPKRTVKLCKAIAAGVPLVCFKWIEDAIAQKENIEWPSPKDYIHPLSRALDQPKIFAGTQFYFGAWKTNEKQSDLEAIVRFGGGEVLSLKPKPGSKEFNETAEKPGVKLVLVGDAGDATNQRSGRRVTLASIRDSISGSVLVEPSWILDQCCEATKKEDENPDTATINAIKSPTDDDDEAAECSEFEAEEGKTEGKKVVAKSKGGPKQKSAGAKRKAANTKRKTTTAKPKASTAGRKKAGPKSKAGPKKQKDVVEEKEVVVPETNEDEEPEDVSMPSKTNIAVEATPDEEDVGATGE